MIIKVDDEFANILIDAIDALLTLRHDYKYTMQDVPKIASLGIYFNEQAKKAVKNYVDQDEKFAQEHPEFVRGANPDEHFVMGKGLVKNKPEDKK